MSGIKLINGGIFTDFRGQISHVNDFDMSEVAHFYLMHHDDTSEKKGKVFVSIEIVRTFAYI